jgi:hypothetical protein
MVLRLDCWVPRSIVVMPASRVFRLLAISSPGIEGRANRMVPTDRGFSRVPVYAAMVLAAAVWVWTALTVAPLPRLLVPIGVAALPLVGPDRIFKAVVGLALTLMCVCIWLTSLSVGLFLVPSAVALGIAAILPPR